MDALEYMTVPLKWEERTNENIQKIEELMRCKSDDDYIALSEKLNPFLIVEGDRAQSSSARILRAMRDMKQLVSDVQRIKDVAKKPECKEKDLEAIGVRVQEYNSALVFRKDLKIESRLLRRLFKVDEHLHANDYGNECSALFELKYELAGEDPYRKGCFGLIDAIMDKPLSEVNLSSKQGRLEAICRDYFTTLWVELSSRFDELDIVWCKTCGKAMAVIRSQGLERRFCSDNCRSKYSRARKYWELVHEGIDSAEATKRAHVSRQVIESILNRNPGDFGTMME